MINLQQIREARDIHTTIHHLEKLANHPNTGTHEAAAAKRAAEHLRKIHNIHKETPKSKHEPEHDEKFNDDHFDQPPPPKQKWHNPHTTSNSKFKWSHELKDMPKAEFGEKTEWRYSKGPRGPDGTRTGHKGTIKKHIQTNTYSVHHPERKPHMYKTFKDAHEHLKRFGYTSE